MLRNRAGLIIALGVWLAGGACQWPHAGPGPEMIVSREEYRAMWNDEKGYWTPSAEEIARAKAALQKAIKGGKASPFGAGVSTPLSRYALTWCGVTDGNDRLIQIDGWTDWRRTGGPLKPGTLVLDAGQDLWFQVFYVVTSDSITGMRPSLAKRFPRNEATP